MEKPNEGSVDFPWYALRFFSNREHKIEKFLEKENLTFFIPMTYKYIVDRKDENSKPKRVLAPACAHLLFLRKDKPEDRILELLNSYTEPVKLYKLPGSSNICEISADEMLEFRMMCDAGLKHEILDIIPPDENLEGSEVVITKGPFKGVEGILKREKRRNNASENHGSKNYYVIKNYGCVAVKIRVINGMFRRRGRDNK